MHQEGNKTTRLRGKRPGKGARLFVFRLVILCVGPLASSCGRSQGELLFLLGVGRGAKVEAQFRLTNGPIMILVDDASERVDWPAARRELADDLAQELRAHKAAKKVIPRETVEHLRQSVPDFEKRGCREIGERGGAEQVLWIEVQDFLADRQIEEAVVAAYFTVTVKVINVLEKQRRSRVRLWPKSPAGRLVTVSLTGSEVARAKTRGAISSALASRLASRIAKLFYDHRLGDFERGE